jgi:hypothetical protein
MSLIPPASTYVVIVFLVVSVITVIITVIVDALSFVERYPALTCSADMLRHADCSAGMTWHDGMLSTEDPNNARTNWNAEIWALVMF